MHEVKSFRDITNAEMMSVAIDITSHMTDPRSDDLRVDFPGLRIRFGGSIADTHDQLLQSAQSCHQGGRDRFVVFCQGHVAGLSYIETERAQGRPEHMDSQVPNLSGFIFSQWRRRGLGRLSLLHRLEVVDEYFDGQAYAVVRKDNIASHRLMRSIGVLRLIDPTADPLVYAYNSRQDTCI